jgi:hypothetical protein
MSVDHLPWCGPDYGKLGPKIAIVGYSHHRSQEDIDDDQFTIATVKEFIELPVNEHLFFAKVRSYFGEADCAAFWSRVLFFNALPDCIGVNDGERDERFDHGTSDQCARAKPRFLRILADHQPDKVLVFTEKGWRTIPNTIEEERGEECPALSPEFTEFSRGTYMVNGKAIAAFGLRHPQGARTDLMRAAVEHIKRL